MNESTAPALIVSFFLTWGIGLVPPLLVRYVFIKRSINNWPAIGVCTFLWVVNVMLFKAMGSQSKAHGALLLVAFVSYWILRRNPKEPQIRNVNQKTRSRRLRTNDPGYVRCSKCDLEQWVGYEKWQKCGARLV
jgi:hypothetical protein